MMRYLVVTKWRRQEDMCNASDEDQIAIVTGTNIENANAANHAANGEGW